MYKAPARTVRCPGDNDSALTDCVEKALDETAAGDGFVLVTERDPRGACLRLLARRRGRFAWHPLRWSGRKYEVEVRRRDGGPETIESAVSEDHDRLRVLLHAVRGADANTIANVAGRFAGALTRHCRMEERLLFPAFHYKAHLRYGPLAEVLTDQHSLLLRNRDELLAAAASGLIDEAAGLADHMGLTMEAHFEKAETSLLPASDALLDEDKRRFLLDEMKLFVPEDE